MENFIEAIRAAAASDATEEVRAAGAQACRMILQVLDAKAGEPLTSAVAAPQSPVASMVATMRGMPIDQLLEIAIAKLRSALPEGRTVPEVEPLRINLVALPQLARKS